LVNVFSSKKVDKKDGLNYDRIEMFKFFELNKLRFFFRLSYQSFLLFIITLLFYWPFVSMGFVFEKNVAEGEEDLSIKNLQIVLNQDEKTQVAESGAGSPGLETNFFGARTRGALTRFQRLNSISGEYGLVGPKTRLALNRKLAETYFAKTSTSTSEFSGQLLEIQKPFVLKLPFGVRGNATRLADKKSPYLKRLEKKEESGNKKLEIVGKPKIVSLSPTRGVYGTRVTIKGENFTSVGNTIYTGYSILKNISSSDKKTLTFTANAFGTEYQQSRGLINYFKPFSIPFLVYVKNTNGQSNSLIFNYQF
jgi:peptidoglycan hydrolase-like protein with peptidoglycan-binding domain